MIRHIVFWNLCDEAEGADKYKNAAIIKTSLESLVGKIDGLKRAEVNMNYNPNGFDLCFFSEFTDKKALELYQINPLHMSVKKFVHKVIKERVVTDCEIN